MAVGEAACDALSADDASAEAGVAGPVAARRPAGRVRSALGSALADITPLRTSADFRRVWLGQSVSSIGQQMTALAVSVQVYALTHSSFATGVVGLCSLIPIVVIGLYGGVIADRFDRRKIGLVGASGLAALSALLAVQAFLGVGQVWVLYAVVAGQAVFFALNSPARAAMVPKLVPAGQLAAANALSTVSMNLGLTVGPMLGGVLIGTSGYQAAYLVDAIGFAGSLYAMWRLPAMRPDAAEAHHERATVLTGLRFLRTRPNLRASFLADIIAMVFGMPRAIFPALAVAFYHGGAGTVGLLTAAPAVGALLGALFSGWVGRVRRHGLAVVLAVLSWGLTIAAFGLIRNLWIGLLLLAAAGCSDTVSMIFRNTIMQVAAPDRMRGRLQGIFTVVVAGGPRLGDFETGTVAQLTSPAFSVVSGGLACVAGIVLMALMRPAFLAYDAENPAP